MGQESVDAEALERVIAEASASGGAIGQPKPAMAREENRHNDCVFERRIALKHPDGSTAAGRIDCYRRGYFILDAKLSGKRGVRITNSDG